MIDFNSYFRCFAVAASVTFLTCCHQVTNQVLKLMMCCIEARRWCEDSNRAPGRPSSPQVSGYSQSCPSVVFVDLHCFAGYVCRLIKMNIDIIGGSVCFLIVFIQNTSTLINCIWIDLQWKNHHAFSTVLCFYEPWTAA